MTVGELMNFLEGLDRENEVVVQECDAMGQIHNDAAYGLNHNREIVDVARGHMEAVVILGVGPSSGGPKRKG